MDEIKRLADALIAAQQELQKLTQERDYIVAARQKLLADANALATRITEAQAAVTSARAALKAAL